MEEQDNRFGLISTIGAIGLVFMGFACWHVDWRLGIGVVGAWLSVFFWVMIWGLK